MPYNARIDQNTFGKLDNGERLMIAIIPKNPTVPIKGTAQSGKLAISFSHRLQRNEAYAVCRKFQEIKCTGAQIRHNNFCYLHHQWEARKTNKQRYTIAVNDYFFLSPPFLGSDSRLAIGWVICCPSYGLKCFLPKQFGNKSEGRQI